jgi:hypothetical protein
VAVDKLLQQWKNSCRDPRSVVEEKADVVDALALLLAASTNNFGTINEEFTFEN